LLSAAALPASLFACLLFVLTLPVPLLSNNHSPHFNMQLTTAMVVATEVAVTEVAATAAAVAVAAMAGGTPLVPQVSRP
jgi:histidinol dehydrogenase